MFPIFAIRYSNLIFSNPLPNTMPMEPNTMPMETKNQLQKPLIPNQELKPILLQILQKEIT